MPASASRHRANVVKSQGESNSFLLAARTFFCLQLAPKKASSETRPRGAHNAGLAARLAGVGDVPSVPEVFFRFGGRRAGRRCGRFRANPTHDRASSKNAAIDLQRAHQPTATPPTGSAPRRPTQPDLRRGAQQATPPTGFAQRRPHFIHAHGCAPSGRITCTALPKPPAGPSEGFA